MNKKTLDKPDLTLPDALTAKSPPKQLEVRDGVFRAAEGGAPAALVDFDKYAAELAAEWAKAVIDPTKRRQARQAFIRIGRLMRFTLSNGAPIPAMDRPQNAAGVVPATDAVLKIIPIIRDEARFAVRHLSVDQAQEVTEYLDDIKDLLAAVDAISDDLNALRALGENHLYEFVRIFDHKTFALLEDDAEVAQRLLPLDTLLRGAARRGAVTKRSMDKVATKAVENALKNNTLNTQKPAEPSEPATPPVVGAPPRTTKRA